MIEELFQPGVSLLHRADARLKTAWALGFVVALALTPPEAWISLGVFSALLMVGTLMGGVSLRVVLGRLRWAWPFLVLTLPWLWSTPGAPLVTLPWGVSVTPEGVRRWLGLVWRLSASLWVVALLLLSTPFNLILKTLKGWGVPDTLITVVQLTWRYLFVLAEEAQRLMRARAARSGTARGGGSLRWRSRVTGNMVGSLLVRGLERADRVHAAMLARGFDGTLRGGAALPLRARQWWSIVVGWVLLLVIAGLRV